MNAISENINATFYKWFHALGGKVARYPVTVIAVTSVIVLGLSVGILRLQFIENPEQLWVSPSNKFSIEQDEFNNAFGPFWRLEQIILVSSNKSQSNILTFENLLALQTLEDEIAAAVIDYEGKSYNLTDLCYEPLPGAGCLVTSPTGYLDQLDFCDGQLYSSISYSQSMTSCLVKDNATPTYPNGVPVEPKTVFGGPELDDYLIVGAKAFFVTYFLNADPNFANVAAAWEKEVFIRICAEAKLKGLEVHYWAQRSIQDQISLETNSDATTIAISYAVMFVYISLTLGNIHVVKSKFLLGLTGVLIVISSLASAVGICALAGARVTLIISEVIPFLILAIGVDNMFIIVSAFNSTPTELDIPERMSLALAHVGASITLASVSEFVAFMLGAATKMPALQSFCLYAAVAVMCDFVLQVTVFVAALSLDARRVKSNRVDCIPCITSSASQDTVLARGGCVRHVMGNCVAPVLFHPVGKTVVVCGFTTMLIIGMYGSMHLTMGLDQTIVLPSDSYLVSFFNLQNEYLQVGPPIYIVLPEFNYSYTVKDSESGLSIVDTVINVFDTTDYVEGPVYSFVDGLYAWVKATQLNYSAIYDDPLGIPHSEEQFMSYLHEWFAMPCSAYQTGQTQFCAAAYLDDVQFSDSGAIEAARLRAYHSVLSTQDDFIGALNNAQYACERTGVPCYPYSVFYIYFAQYLNIDLIAIQNLLLAAGAVFVVCLILLANLWSSILISLVVTMIDWDLLGGMYFWDISINAVSVVNLVMATGLSVEFCVHISRAYIHASGTPDERAKKALVDMGTNVFSGITMTKFCGVAVLGFASSQLFQIYYFRMYLMIVVLGGAHAILFLPVMLSLIGPPELPASVTRALSSGRGGGGGRLGSHGVTTSVGDAEATAFLRPKTFS